MRYFVHFLLVLVLAFFACEAREPRCLQPIEAGLCFGHMEKYGFDVTTEECTKFVYGGCQGNDNQFDSLEECQAAC